MKKYHILYAMSFLLFCPVSCIDEQFAEHNRTDMKISLQTEQLVGSRGALLGEYLPENSQIGVFVMNNQTLGAYNGKEYSNLEAQAHGTDEEQTWALSEPVYFNNIKARAVAYYPYDGTAFEYSSIPIENGLTDYLYSGWVTDLNAENNLAHFNMKHAMFDMNWLFKKGGYEGEGIISSLRIKSAALASNACLDASTGNFTAVEGLNTFLDIPLSSTLDSEGVGVEWLAIPAGNGNEMEMIVVVDGQEFSGSFIVPQNIQPGYRVFGTFVLNNSGFEVQDINIEGWEDNVLEEKNTIPYSSYLTVVYNVTDISTPTKLINSSSTLKEMWVDGEMVAPTSSYSFSETGEHTVKFQFTNEKLVSNFNNNKCIARILAWPTRMETVLGTAFNGCTSLTEIAAFNDNLSNIGNNAFSGCTGLTGTLNIPNSVTTIGNSAFQGCTGLTSVTIGAGVQTIGDYAFGGCKNIETMTVNEENTVYDSRDNCNAIIKTETGKMVAGSKNTIIPDGCKIIPKKLFGAYEGLTGELVIPSSMQILEDSVFYNCTGLTGLTIEKGIQTLGTGVFAGCTELKGEVVLPNSLNSIGKILFYGCSGIQSLVIEEGITSLPDFDYKYGVGYKGCFQGCTSLQTVSLPESLQIITGYAFNGCTGLTEVTIPNSVTSIGQYAFNGCTGLTELHFGDGVQTIGNYAFAYCSGLTEVTIPESVTTIGGYAFNRCSGITGTLTIPESVVDIQSSAFADCSKIASIEFNEGLKSIGNNAFARCTGLTGTLNIPNSVTTIGGDSNTDSYHDGTFCRCTGLTEIKLGSGVRSIANQAFKDCTGVVALQLNEGLEKIGGRAFIGCKNITGKLVIPSSVKIIGDGAFKYCDGLTELELNGTDVIIQDATYYNYNAYEQQVGAFQSCTGLTTVKISGVRHIGNYAFADCTGLVSFDFDSEVQTIGNYAFSGCTGLTGTFLIKDGVVNIGTEAFNGCTGITGVQFGKNVEFIDSSAFKDCYNLSSLQVVDENTTFDSRDNCNAIVMSLTDELVIGCKNSSIPEGIRIIGAGAFNGCTGLTGTLTLPQSVQGVKAKAFYGCTGLTGLVLNDGLQLIGDAAFMNCSNIEGELVIPNSVTSVGSHYSYEYGSSTGAFKNCKKISSVKFGTGISSIADVMFSHCSGLTGTLTIPGNITKIGKHSFGDCTKISEVIFEEGVESIDYGAFMDCSSLVKIELPSTIKALGWHEDAYEYRGAFKNCNLNYVVCKSQNPPSAESSQVFLYGTQNTGTLLIPTGRSSAYSIFRARLGNNWSIIEQDF